MQERRDSRRVEVNGDCELKVLYSRSDPKSAVTRKYTVRIGNVSEGGLYLKTPEIFQEGDLADCHFGLGRDGKSSSLGLVKWLSPGKGVGIEFFHGSEGERNSVQKDVRGAMDRG